MAQAWLISGPSSIAIARVVNEKVKELEAAHGEVMVTDLQGGDIKEGGFPDMRTQDLFGSARCVIIHQADAMSAAVGGLLNAELEAGELEVELILTAEKALASRKLMKTMKDRGGYIEIAVPKDTDTRGWNGLVKEEYQRVGLKADADAIAVTIERGGYNLDIISQKVAQVRASVTGNIVSGEAVANILVGHGSKGAFTVADHMLAGDVEEALKALRGCFDAGLEPLSILGALTYRVRQLISVITQVPPAEGGVFVPAAQRNQLLAARSRFGPGDITRMMAHLFACDLEIKNGDLGQQAALERCVLSIASSPLWLVPNPQREILR